MTSRCTPKRRNSRGMTHGKTLSDIGKNYSPRMTRTGLTLTAHVWFRCKLTLQSERKTGTALSLHLCISTGHHLLVIIFVTILYLYFIHVSKHIATQNTCNSINSQAQHTYAFYLKDLSLYFLLRHYCQGQSCTRDSYNYTCLWWQGEPLNSAPKRSWQSPPGGCFIVLQISQYWVLSLTHTHRHTCQIVRTEPARPTR
jgi:hypothetical protein